MNLRKRNAGDTGYLAVYMRVEWLVFSAPHGIADLELISRGLQRHQQVTMIKDFPDMPV
jgi:hypothetical protein